MVTKLIDAPKQDVQQQDVPKQDVHQKVEVELDEYLAVFPEYPPRGDMNNPFYLHEPSHMRSLAIHFGRDETTFVMSEVPVSTSATIRREHRRPDLMVAFDCDRELLISQNGYAIVTQGKPPDFVLEVASESTGEVDYTDKRDEYESYGIPEYWRFDSSGGDYHNAALAGDRLVDGRYEPIEIQVIDGLNRRGYSEVLDLWLCWEDQRLRLFDAKAGAYLRTHDEEYDRAELEAYERRQAELRAIQAELRVDEERDLRLQVEYERRQAEIRADQAETRANQAEAHAQEAETRAAQEASARQHAEAEARNLRAQLDALTRRSDDQD